MIATVRRCDQPRCGKEIGEGRDFLVLRMAVSAHRNDASIYEIETEPISLYTPIELCSQACAMHYVQGLLDKAKA